MRYLLNFILLLSLVNIVYSQDLKSISMGNQTTAIQTEYSGLNIYDFSGNPAWLIKDQDEDILNIYSGFSNSYGNYRRYFSPEGISSQSIVFDQTKILRSSGTFRGIASYENINMREKNRSLRLNPYDGDAFFFSDTTSGNFNYKGPSIVLEHSLEITNKFLIGWKIDYALLRGLKQIYSFAETRFREAKLNIGAAYIFNPDLTLGISYDHYDSKESISANDINSINVITYLYRGEKQRIQRIGLTVTEDIKKYYDSGGLQLHWNPYKKISSILSFNYKYGRKKIIYPRNSITFTEGISKFEKYTSKFRLKYEFKKYLAFNLSSEYSYKSNWSKNPQYNLLIWKWNLSQTKLILGTNYKSASFPFELTFEVEYSRVSADSSKHMDNRFVSKNSDNYGFRIGGEYEFSKFYLRAGFSFYNLKFDHLLGGSKRNIITYTLGTGFNISGKSELQFAFLYNVSEAEKIAVKKLNEWQSYINLKIYGDFF